jgi:hypothetical protein
VVLDVERVVLGLCPGLAPFCKLVTAAKVCACIIWDAENCVKLAIPTHNYFRKKAEPCGLKINY